jgi:hypothetical protein
MFVEDGEGEPPDRPRFPMMLASILVTLIVLVALVDGFRFGHRGELDLIVHRPYNNLHNDASGARDFHFG